MRNARRFRRWVLRSAAVSALLLPGCLGALQSALDPVFSPSAAGNLVRAPYTLFADLVRLVARLRP